MWDKNKDDNAGKFSFFFFFKNKTVFRRKQKDYKLCKFKAVGISLR